MILPGNPNYQAERADLLTTINQLEQEGKMVVWVAETSEVFGLIAIADTIQPEATVETLSLAIAESTLLNPGMNFSVGVALRATPTLKFILQISNAAESSWLRSVVSLVVFFILKPFSRFVDFKG